MEYSIRISNYLKRMSLFDSTLMMSMADLVAIGVETPRIDNGCSFDVEFIEFIFMNL